MAEYIEREALIKDVRLLPRLAPYNSVLYSSVQRAIFSAPTADMVEVVRCKNCKHYEANYLPGLQKNDTFGVCDMYEFLSEEYCLRDETDFCSYGERKEGAEK